MEFQLNKDSITDELEALKATLSAELQVEEEDLDNNSSIKLTL